MVFCCRDEEGPSVNLFDHWIRHYRSIGVTHIHAVGWGQRDAVMFHFAREHGIASLRHVPGDKFCVLEATRIKQQALAKLPTDAWVMTPDEDEFLACANVQEVAKISDAAGWSYVPGYLLDCFDAYGQLRRVSLQPLELQFPLRCRFTRDVVQGGDAKVVLWKNNIEVGCGHHHPMTPFANGHPLQFPVLHYKWTAGVRDRVLKLQKTAKEKEYQWDLNEYQRTLDAMTEDGMSVKLSEIRRASPV